MCNDTIIVFLIRNDMKTPVDKPYSSFEGNNVCFQFKPLVKKKTPELMRYRFFVCVRLRNEWFQICPQKCVGKNTKSVQIAKQCSD